MKITQISLAPILPQVEVSSLVDKAMTSWLELMETKSLKVAPVLTQSSATEVTISSLVVPTTTRFKEAMVTTIFSEATVTTTSKVEPKTITSKVVTETITFSEVTVTIISGVMTATITLSVARTELILPLVKAK